MTDARGWNAKDIAKKLELFAVGDEPPPEIMRYVPFFAMGAIADWLDSLPAPASDARGWQPIAEAPPDTLLWTLWDGMNRRTNEPARHYHAAALQDGEWIDDQGEAIDTPTHWRPLPAPPADEAKP